jgi:hypothetical protein
MRTALGAVLWTAALLGGAGAQGIDGADRILLTDRTERRGEITGCDSTGCLELRETEGGRKVRILAEEVRRIRFGSDESPQSDPRAERLHLFNGGSLSGRLRSYEGGVAEIETPAGTFRVRRADIRSLSLAPILGTFPELKEEKKDILIDEVTRGEGAEAKKECSARYGELRSVDAERVVFRSGKDEAIPRETVRKIYLQADRPGAGEVPQGWFAKVAFRNGDRITGILSSVGKGRLRIFSHLVGEVEIEKRHVLALAFSPAARMSADNILVCDQNGVRDFDAQGREVWTYAHNVNVAGNARRLENGNVLIANMNFNQVLEIEPSGKSGGRVAWQLDNLGYPSDAVRLENGNTLVAEQHANHVAEYDARSKASVWKTSVMPYPTSIQRLENGNTLICSFQGLVEADREGKVKWTLAMGRVRPWRAQRLENGNTLVVDQQNNQVVEVDPQSKEVWRMSGLQRPVQAIRLEDGNTLILEQGAGRVIEVDPSKRSQDRITGLNMPQAMSTH